MVCLNQTLTVNSPDTADTQVLLGLLLPVCLRLLQELLVELASVWVLLVNKALRTLMRLPQAKLKDSGLPVTQTLTIRITGAVSFFPF